MVGTFFTDIKNKFEDSMRGSKPIATLTSSIFPPTDTEKIKKYNRFIKLEGKSYLQKKYGK